MRIQTFIVTPNLPEPLKPLLDIARNVWWVLDPLILVGVYALVFGSWLGLRHGPEGLAYPLFLACALIPWRWFSTATISGANAFVRNGSLLTSVPLRRGSVVLAEQLATLAVALAGLPILALFMWFYDKPATWELLWLPCRWRCWRCSLRASATCCAR